MRGKVQLGTPETPILTDFQRGLVTVIDGESGVDDVLVWIRKNAADVIEMITIPTTGGGGSSPVIQNDDTTVAAAASTIDFSSAFRVSESPANEANIFLDTRYEEFTVAYPPQYSGSFTLTDADISSGNRLNMWRVRATAQLGDELEMDTIVFSPLIPSAGTATVYWHAYPGPILGIQAFRYIIADS